MININLWNNNKIDPTFSILLKKSFSENNLKEFNLVNNKTYVICIFDNKKIIGTISLISNDDLISFLKVNKKNYESLLGTYSFKAEKGAYIYNLAVDKNYRSQGFGLKLLNIAMYIAKLKGFKYVQAHCVNDASYQLFKKNRFSMENTFENDKRIVIKLMTYWL